MDVQFEITETFGNEYGTVYSRSYLLSDSVPEEYRGEIESVIRGNAASVWDQVEDIRWGKVSVGAPVMHLRSIGQSIP